MSILRTSALYLNVFAIICFLQATMSVAQTKEQSHVAQPNVTQVRREPEIARLGIGVGIIPYTFPYNQIYDVQPAGVLSWYIPVQIGQHFRVETEFALASAQDRFPLALDSQLTAQNVRNSLFFRVGVGTYYTHPFDASTRLYCGLRSGIVSSSVEWFSSVPQFSAPPQTPTYIYNESLASFWIGGVVGFEYLLTRHITLGAELHGTSYTTGQPHTSSPIPSNYPRRFNPQFSSDAFVSSALVAVRFFF